MNYNLENHFGLQILFIDIPDANSITTEILVKAGSIYENENNNGIAHFLEHMFFKGGKKYKTPKDVAQAVENFGGEFNAFTANYYAGYYVKSAPSYCQQAIDVLADMMVHSQFPEEEMQREKQVVIQEMMMYEDNPQSLVWDKRNQRRFGENPRGKTTLGTKENVLGFTRENLQNYKKNLYTKDNMLLILSGKIIDKQKIIKKITDLFQDLPEKSSLPSIGFSLDIPGEKESFFDKKTQQNHLIISAKGFKHNEKEKYEASVLMTILGGNMSSRLFQNIREKKGLCYYIGATHQVEKKTGTFLIYAGIDKDRFDSGVKSIYEELEIFVKNGFTKEEFENAKGYLIGQLQMGLETTDSFAGFLGKQQLLFDEVKNLDEIITIYKNITFEKVKSLLPSLKKEKLFLYYIK